MNVYELFAKISLDTTEYESGLSESKNSLANFGSASMDALGTVAGVAKNAVSAIAGAAVDVGKVSVDAGMAFDKSMSNVAAISGATGDDFEALRQKAKQMGSTTAFTATEAANAFSYMAMAGWKTEDMLNGIEGIMNLSAASGEDLALTSDIITDAMTAFGLKAKDASRFADLLAATSSNSNTNVAMLGESFKYAAPVAGALGVSAEDTAYALGLMANAGIKASMAGTSLRAGLTNIIKPTDEMEAAMKKYGIALTKNEDGEVDLAASIADMRKSFSQLPEDEKAAAAAAIFGKNAMSGWLAVMTASEDDASKLSVALANASGTAENMADIQLDNLAGDITLFKSAIEGVEIIISDKLKKPLRAVVQYATEGLSAVTAAYESGGFKAAIDTAANIVTTGLSNVIKKIPEWISAGVSFLSEGIPAFLASITGMMSSGITTLTESGPEWIAKGAELITNFVLGIFEHRLEFLDTIISLIGDFLGLIVEKGPEILQKGSELLQYIIDGIGANLPMLILKAGELITTLLNTLTEYLPQLLDMGFQFIMQIATGLLEHAPEILTAIGTVISDLLGFIIEHLPEFLSQGADMILQMVNGLGEQAPTIIASLGDIIANLISQLMDSLPEFLAKGIEIVAKLAVGLIQNIPAIANAILKVILKLISTITSKFPDFMTKGKEVVSKIGSGITSMVNTAINAIKTIITNIKTQITSFDWLSAGRNIISGIASGISGAVGTVVSAAKSVGSSILSAITGFFEIFSPSHVMRDKVGKMLSKGIAVGFEEESPEDEIVDSVSGTVDRVKASLQGLDGATLGTDINVSAQQPDVENSFAFQNLETRLNSILAALTEYLPYLPGLAQMQIVTDTGVLVGELAPGMDAALGRISARRARGWA